MHMCLCINHILHTHMYNLKHLTFYVHIYMTKIYIYTKVNVYIYKYIYTCIYSTIHLLGSYSYDFDAGVMSEEEGPTL